jgi:hypothetical protein
MEQVECAPVPPKYSISSMANGFTLVPLRHIACLTLLLMSLLASTREFVLCLLVEFWISLIRFPFTRLSDERRTNSRNFEGSTCNRGCRCKSWISLWRRAFRRAEYVQFRSAKGPSIPLVLFAALTIGGSNLLSCYFDTHHTARLSTITPINLIPGGMRWPTMHRFQ